MKLLEFLLGGPPRPLERTEVDGVIVSTVDTPDCGFETAIVDRNGAYPVQRYETEEEGIKGHSAWCIDIIGKHTIVMIGWDDENDTTEIKLERFSKQNI